MKLFQEVLHGDAVYTASLNEHLMFLLSEIPRSFANGEGHTIPIGGIILDPEASGSKVHKGTTCMPVGLFSIVN